MLENGSVRKSSNQCPIRPLARRSIALIQPFRFNLVCFLAIQITFHEIGSTVKETGT